MTCAAGRHGDPVTFVGVWPVVEPLPAWVLIEEATADLPKVLARHHAELTGAPQWTIRPGASTPGSGGAASVVYCEAPAVRVARVDYRRLEKRRGAA